MFAQLKSIVQDSYDRIVGLLLEDLAVDGCITKASGGGQVAGPSPAGRRKLGMKRSLAHLSADQASAKNRIGRGRMGQILSIAALT